MSYSKQLIVRVTTNKIMKPLWDKDKNILENSPPELL